MSEKFPHHCVCCGFCCLVTPCPQALMMVPNAVSGKPCPELEFKGDVAGCGLYEKLLKFFVGREDVLTDIFGIGQCCCIKAEKVVGGQRVAFASLEKHRKNQIVESFRRKFKNFFIEAPTGINA